MRYLPSILLVPAALFAGTAALAQDSGWRISEVDGQVSVIRDDTPIYGEEGLTLHVDDIVTTSEAGRAVLVRDTEFFVVAPGRRVRIKLPEKGSRFAQILDYLGDMLVSDPEPTGRRATQVATVVKGYGNSDNGNDVLASVDAKMSMTDDE
jgi:hypothetical protein